MNTDIIIFLRQFRIGGFTIFDTAVSFLAVYLLAPILTKLFRYIGLEIPRKTWLYLVLPIGVLAHFLSGTATPLTREFLDSNGFYVLKLVIVSLLVLGLKGIRRSKTAV